MLADLIIRIFFGSKIKKAVEQMRNDPDIRDSEMAVEYAVQNWIDAVKRQEEFSASDEMKRSRAYAEKLRQKRLSKQQD